MDYVLIGFVGFGALNGVKRGGFSIIFSLLSTFLAFFLSYRLCNFGADLLKNIPFFDVNTQNFIQNQIENLVDVNFSSVDEFFQIVEKRHFGFVLVFLLRNVFKNFAVEGEISVSHAMAVRINDLLVRVVSFIIIFAVVRILVYFLTHFTQKFLTIFKLNSVNRVLGLCLGVLYGFLLFSIVYYLALLIGNFTLNRNILDFVQNAQFSKLLYSSIFEKTINLII